MINPIKEYSYDRKADAIYITLSNNAVSYTRSLDDTRIIDYDKNNNPVGIELLCVGRGVISDELPHAEAISRLLTTLQIKEYA